MNSNIIISKEDSFKILQEINTKFKLTNNDMVEEGIDEELKNSFIAREVAIFIKKGNLLDENEFYLVKFPYDDKTLDISVGYVKTIKNDSPKLVYGVVYK